MARQHAAFGLLLDDAVGSSALALSSPLSAGRTTNSAMHWEAAASLIAARRLDAQTARVQPPPTPTPQAGGGGGRVPLFWGQPASGHERYTPADVHAAWVAEKQRAHSEMLLSIVDKTRSLYAALGSARRASSAEVLQP
jgi:hypothetical protein